jgi:tetratricopeptide (TPR) repeat protein
VGARVVAATVACVWLWAGLPVQAVHADQRDPRLRPLLDQLAECREPRAGEELVRQIWEIWDSAGEPGIDRIMQRSTEALRRGEYLRAVEGFTQVVERRPDFAEGWNKRATAYFQMRDFESSIRDVVKVLELEPRHFAALSGMGLMYNEMGADAPALRWFERALAVHPCMGGVKQQVDELRARLANGRT